MMVMMMARTPSLNASSRLVRMCAVFQKYRRLRRDDGLAVAWETPRMRMSDFWRLMDDEFGAAYARSLARDHVLGALGNRSPMEAIESGVKPRDAWLALCADMDVPLERRLGKEMRDHTKELRDLRKKG